jgi:hypothetical protein
MAVVQVSESGGQLCYGYSTQGCVNLDPSWIYQSRGEVAKVTLWLTLQR